MGPTVAVSMHRSSLSATATTGLAAWVVDPSPVEIVRDVSFWPVLRYAASVMMALITIRSSP
jgi:hypothetical protein